MPVALQLGQGIWWQRHAFRGVHACKTLGGLAQGWFEIANPQPGQGRLYPDHNTGAFPDQAVTPALQQLGVEPVGFRPAMFPRHRDTRGMDHVSLDATRRKPARQPEAVAAGFEGKRNPRDRAPGPDRLIPPALQQGKQPFWARLELLAR